VVLQKGGIMSQFTDAKIRSLQPKETPYRLYEKASDKGFHVQVTPAGRISFGFAYTFNKKKRFLKLGDYSNEFKLKNARAACRQKQSLLDDGVDPKLERFERRIKQAIELKKLEDDKKELNRAATVNEILDHYLKDKAENTIADAQRVFTNKYCNVRKVIGKMKIYEVTDDVLEELIDTHISRNRMRTAGKLYAYLQGAFKTAKRNKPFRLKHWSNPFDNIEKPEGTDSKPVNRALSADEIKKFWELLEKNPTNMMDGLISILKILLLTGQRVEQTSRMQWEHVDFENNIWDVPPSETKTGKRTGVGHVVPLTPMVVDIIKSMPIIDDEIFIFPGMKALKPFSMSGISNPLQKLLKTSDIEAFTARDLRRTFTTHLSRLGVLAEIRNRIQNHAISGDVESKHYNRFDYANEKKDALEKWERELKHIVNIPVEDNIIKFTRGS